MALDFNKLKENYDNADSIYDCADDFRKLLDSSEFEDSLQALLEEETKQGHDTTNLYVRFTKNDQTSDIVFTSDMPDKFNITLARDVRLVFNVQFIYPYIENRFEELANATGDCRNLKTQIYENSEICSTVNSRYDKVAPGEYEIRIKIYIFGCSGNVPSRVKE